MSILGKYTENTSRKNNTKGYFKDKTEYEMPAVTRADEESISLKKRYSNILNSPSGNTIYTMANLNNISDTWNQSYYV